jgi:hypothetical protein
MTDADLHEIKTRADHTAHFRRLANLGQWTFDGESLYSGGIRVATFPRRSAGDVRRASFYGRFLLELLTSAPEADTMALLEEVRKARAIGDGERALSPRHP